MSTNEPDWDSKMDGEDPVISLPELIVMVDGMNADQVKDATGNADSAVTLAAETTIEDDDDYASAGALLTEVIKPALVELERTFRPMKRAAKKTHSEICAQCKRHEEPLLRAEETLKASMLTYHQAQQQIAAQEEAERLDEARRAAEDIKVEEAARLERDGHQEAADERLEEPIAPIITTPAPRQAAPKAKGTQVRKTWGFEIYDQALIFRKFLKPDLQKIRGTVTSMGPDAADVVGGIEVIEKVGMSARAR